MKDQNIPIPKSLRKHIRARKAALRREFGEQSEQYKEFCEWVEKEREGIMSLKTAVGK